MTATDYTSPFKPLHNYYRYLYLCPEFRMEMSKYAFENETKTKGSSLTASYIHIRTPYTHLTFVYSSYNMYEVRSVSFYYYVSSILLCE